MADYGDSSLISPEKVESYRRSFEEDDQEYVEETQQNNNSFSREEFEELRRQQELLRKQLEEKEKKITNLEKAYGSQSAVVGSLRKQVSLQDEPEEDFTPAESFAADDDEDNFDVFSYLRGDSTQQKEERKPKSMSKTYSEDELKARLEKEREFILSEVKKTEQNVLTTVDASVRKRAEIDAAAERLRKRFITERPEYANNEHTSRYAARRAMEKLNSYGTIENVNVKEFEECYSTIIKELDELPLSAEFKRSRQEKDPSTEQILQQQRRVIPGAIETGGGRVVRRSVNKPAVHDGTDFDFTAADAQHYIDRRRGSR